MGLVNQAREEGYEVILLFLALDSAELALQRVSVRVKEGGHNIPRDVIRRRFDDGLNNLFQLYMPIVDKWILVDNSSTNFEFIAEGAMQSVVIKNKEKWTLLTTNHNESQG